MEDGARGCGVTLAVAWRERTGCVIGSLVNMRLLIPELAQEVGHGGNARNLLSGLADRGAHRVPDSGGQEVRLHDDDCSDRRKYQTRKAFQQDIIVECSCHGG